MKNLCSTRPLGQWVLLSAIFVFCITTILEAQNTFPATGNVGIGTATPAAPLDVSGSSIWNGTIRANGSSYSSFALYQSSALRWALYNHPTINNTLLFANSLGQDKFAFTQAASLGIDNISPQVKLDIGGAQGNGLQFRYDQTTNYRIRLTPYWNSNADTRLDFNFERAAGAGFYTAMSIGYNNRVGINTITPGAWLDVKTDSAPQLFLSTSRTLSTSRNWGLATNWNVEGDFSILESTAYNTSPVTPRMTIDVNGNIGIGTTSPDAKLAVKGTIHSKEVKVDMLGAMVPDYVFANNYQLLTINELKTYIDQNKHLPEVPSAKEMEVNGINLGEMNMLLLKKVEELTLYQIEAMKRIEKLEAELKSKK